MESNPPGILLINPFVYDFTAFDCWAKPKGLLEVGRLFIELGFRVEVVDCLYKEDGGMAAFAANKKSIRHATTKKYGIGRYFQEEVEKPPSMEEMARRFFRFGFHPEFLRKKLEEISISPLLIGISGIMTYWCRGVKEAVAIAKTCFPGVPVVLGGIYPTLLPEHAARFSGADYIFQGMATPERLQALLARTEAGFAPGALIHAAPAKRKTVCYPYPDASYGVINTSEGCYKRCSYCASALLRPRVIEYDMNEVFEEISLLAAKGMTDFAFYDDFLLSHKEKRLLPLLRRISKELPHLRFHTPNGMHLDHIDEETARLMVQSNFKTLRFGFETANEELGRRTGLKISLSNFKKKIEVLKQAGCREDEIGIYVMIGLPGQTVESVEESLKFVKDCGVKVNITEFSPIAGTVEFNNALKKSLVDFRQDPELQNNSLLPLRDRNFPFDVVNRLKNLAYS